MGLEHAGRSGHGATPAQVVGQRSGRPLLLQPALDQPLPSQTTSGCRGPNSDEPVHLIAQREAVGITQATRDGMKALRRVLQPEDSVQNPAELQPVRRHRQPSRHEAASQCAARQVDRPGQAGDRGEVSRQPHGAANDVACAAVDPQSSPREILGELNREVRGRSADERLHVARIDVVVMRNDGCRPTSPDDVEEIRLCRQRRSWRKNENQHDARRSPACNPQVVG